MRHICVNESIALLFQYNVWAVPCNDKIECESGEDENHCKPSNWHSWLAVPLIFLGLIVLFLGLSMIKFKRKQPDVIDLKDLLSQEFNLLYEKRGNLVLSLHEGGKGAAQSLYKQIAKKEAHPFCYLKVTIIFGSK